jgi:hypothetical protein
MIFSDNIDRIGKRQDRKLDKSAIKAGTNGSCEIVA